MNIPEGFKLVPLELNETQIRQIQVNSEIGTYVCSNWTGAYSLLQELWGVALKAAPLPPQTGAQQTRTWHFGTYSGETLAICNETGERTNEEEEPQTYVLLSEHQQECNALRAELAKSAEIIAKVRARRQKVKAYAEGQRLELLALRQRVQAALGGVGPIYNYAEEVEQLRERLCQRTAQVVALVEECETLRPGADRYRWLREQGGATFSFTAGTTNGRCTHEIYDVLVDDAISRAAQELHAGSTEPVQPAAKDNDPIQINGAISEGKGHGVIASQFIDAHQSAPTAKADDEPV